MVAGDPDAGDAALAAQASIASAVQRTQGAAAGVASGKKAASASLKRTRPGVAEAPADEGTAAAEMDAGTASLSVCSNFGGHQCTAARC